MKDKILGHVQDLDDNAAVDGAHAQKLSGESGQKG
jgi:hypothetical protein